MVSSPPMVITLAARPSGRPPGGPISCTDAVGTGFTRAESRAKSLCPLLHSSCQRPCVPGSLRHFDTRRARPIWRFGGAWLHPRRAAALHASETLTSDSQRPGTLCMHASSSWDMAGFLQGSRDPRAARAIARGLARAWRPQAPPRTPPRRRRPRWPPAALRGDLPRALRRALLSARGWPARLSRLLCPALDLYSTRYVKWQCTAALAIPGAALQAVKLAGQRNERTPRWSIAGRTCICRPV